MQIEAKNCTRNSLANIELGRKPNGVRELRGIVKRYPGTEEDRALSKLKERAPPFLPRSNAAAVTFLLLIAIQQTNERRRFRYLEV